MRYPAAEKLAIICLVEQSRLPVRRTLDKLGILPARFYRWYDRYQSGGYEALKDRPPRPKQVWNRIPDDVRGRVLRLALDAPELSPRELATRFIDTEGYFVSEASVYRLLKAHDLITSPAFVVIKAADAFKDKGPISCGRQTSPTSRSSVGAGSISRPSWTTSRAISSPGNSARRCGPKTSPIRWNWRSRHQAAIRRRSSISRGCCPTTDPAISPATWPNGSMIRAWSMYVAHPIIPRPRAKSSAGTKPSRTGSAGELLSAR